ncbi:SDR family NAD(P)-dependent oxidoreductase [Salinithrix halophila]|uniref:SDR family NAD(P)-dependent oxidoreductase n=1 Tax=Salinithrix halophila TaxID=1485204 RepID=A0ABV8JJT3_9BACL
MPVALVTGASSGIGEAFVRLLAEKSYHIILVSRREERLRLLAEGVEQMGGTAEVVGVDLTTEEGLTRVKEHISWHPVDLLINNAGFGLYGPTSETDPQKEQEMIQLNVRVPVALTRAALPQMIERGSGRVLQVASTSSFLPVPYMAGYGATKAFILHYTEALHAELKGSGITVTALCPGSTESEFAERAGFKQQHPMPAAEVARQGLLACEQGRPFVIPGTANWFTASLPRFLPRPWMTRLVAHFFNDRT